MLTLTNFPRYSGHASIFGTENEEATVKMTNYGCNDWQQDPIAVRLFVRRNFAAKMFLRTFVIGKYM